MGGWFICLFPFKHLYLHDHMFFNYLSDDNDVYLRRSCESLLFQHNETNTSPVSPSKTQISFGIRPVRPESALPAVWVISYPFSAHGSLCSDGADAQADPLAQRSFCSFCRALGYFIFLKKLSLLKINEYCKLYINKIKHNWAATWQNQQN